MIEKNLKKLQAKKHRVFFEGNLGTITHKSEAHQERCTRKSKERKMVFEYCGY